MSAGISTIPAVMDRLVELFKTATEADKTEVWPDRTNEEHQLEENVYLGDVQGSREWKGVGSATPSQREENYGVTVEVEVYRQGTDIIGANARLWEIILALEAAIANNVKLGFEQSVQWALVGRFKQTSGGATDGWMSKATLEVIVKARI